MKFSTDEIEASDEKEHEPLSDDAPEDASDVVDENDDEEGFVGNARPDESEEPDDDEEGLVGDARPDESEEPDDDSQADEESEEALPPPVLPTFIEVEPLRPHEADNTAYAAAVAAYYEEKNYELAIEKFGDAIENERQQTDGSRYEPNEIIAKSLYWQAESYVKMQDISQAIVIFESLIQTCQGHYLTVAAERRAERLKSTKAVSD